MPNPNTLSALTAFATLFVGSQAYALGLGDITLHSRLGEAIRADIPLILSDAPPPEASCFTLVPGPGSDFPVITAAKFKVVSAGNQYRLVVTGYRPLEEPIAAINVSVSCGHDYKREYLLLPPPPTLVESSGASPEHAESAAPVVTSKRKAPPPSPRPSAASQRNAPVNSAPVTLRSSNDLSPDAPSPEKRPESPARQVDSTNKDRVVLGSAPNITPGDSRIAAVEQMDERMLKLETTLRQLTAEVEKLDKALALREESTALQQKIQDLQTRQAIAIAPPAVPNDNDSGSLRRWLELLAGIVVGGSVTGAVAFWANRKKFSSRPFDAPPPRIAKPRNQETL